MIYNFENEISSSPTKNIYVDNDKKIKLFIKNYSKSNILNEALNQSRVEENTKLNIPKLLEVTKIDDRWGLVSEYIYGKTLKEIIESDNKLTNEILEIFVDLQLEMFKYIVPHLNDAKEKYKMKIDENNFLDENTKYELNQRLKSVGDENCLCHGDYDLSNIIIDKDNNKYIIDWSHATIGNRCFDIAQTYLLLILENRMDTAKKYIDLHIKKSAKSNKISYEKINNVLPIISAIRLEKNIESEKDLLLSYINVVDF